MENRQVRIYKVTKSVHPVNSQWCNYCLLSTYIWVWIFFFFFYWVWTVGSTFRVIIFSILQFVSPQLKSFGCHYQFLFPKGSTGNLITWLVIKSTRYVPNFFFLFVVNIYLQKWKQSFSVFDSSSFVFYFNSSLSHSFEPFLLLTPFISQMDFRIVVE